ncbi:MULTISPECIES: ABC transporter permease [unclassified Sedimentibacter]|uniref:ABC transporter permease n=1 Tax=unclassified Sedimentibacter TaxID=2649220 RepID=UPI0027E04E76|nr:ABC transporter permease [Sedimentibacter sp. MB35-C1]WMJ76281.1 ABC transporter permease [Sedimentibacter sp. MB35-C1]
MDTVYFVAQQTMYFAIPLLIVALGGMFSERSGTINIALEGIMVVGAFAGISFINFFQSSMSGQGLLILAILTAGVSGGIFSLFHAFASIKLKADQTISGTALNMFAPAFAIFVARMVQGVQQVQFKDTFYIRSVPVLGNIPVIGPILFQNSYITTYICLGIALLSWAVINHTRFGLRLRACGEHPQAADSVGINVYRIRYAGVLISGVLAGIGGLTFVVPTSTNFNATVAGYGFLALAVLIFGQWRTKKIFFAAFFFGIMKTFASAYSGIPMLKALPISNEIYKMIPYIATLVVLTFSSKNSQAPKAEGIPYDKGSR